MGFTHRKALSWYVRVLPKETRRALEAFSGMAWLKRSRWYLAGGTALALQVGHRASVDLDFFTPQKDFSAAKIIGHFAKNAWVSDIVREGTLYGRLYGARTSFIAYPFFTFRKPYRRYGSVRVLDLQDIAVMKTIAISQRGRRRDFVDLYWHCTHVEALRDVLQRLPDQYATVAHEYHHILKSLTYFADAEDDPMPKLFFNASWEEITAYFRREVPRIARDLLRL